MEIYSSNISPMDALTGEQPAVLAQQAPEEVLKFHKEFMEMGLGRGWDDLKLESQYGDLSMDSSFLRLNNRENLPPEPACPDVGDLDNCPLVVFSEMRQNLNTGGFTLEIGVDRQGIALDWLGVLDETRIKAGLQPFLPEEISFAVNEYDLKLPLDYEYGDPVFRGNIPDFYGKILFEADETGYVHFLIRRVVNEINFTQEEWKVPIYDLREIVKNNLYHLPESQQYKAEKLDNTTLMIIGGGSATFLLYTYLMLRKGNEELKNNIGKRNEQGDTNDESKNGVLLVDRILANNHNNFDPNTQQLKLGVNMILNGPRNDRWFRFMRNQIERTSLLSKEDKKNNLKILENLEMLERIKSMKNKL